MLPTHREDITFDEVLNPSVRWCKSGHDIPPDAKVYSVRGPALPKNSWGQYCELCIVGARIIAEVKKPKNAAEKQSEEEVDVALLKAQLRRAGFTGGIAEPEDKIEKEPWEEFIENHKQY